MPKANVAKHNLKLQYKPIKANRRMPSFKIIKQQVLESTNQTNALRNKTREKKKIRNSKLFLYSTKQKHSNKLEEKKKKLLQRSSIEKY